MKSMGRWVCFTLPFTIALAACGKRSLTPLEQSPHSSAGSEGDALAFWAQGKDITPEFLQNYAGRYANQNSKLKGLRLDNDGTYEIVSGGQMGSHGSKDLPYPTICWLKSAGKIKSVIERSQVSRESYLPFASHVLLLMEESVQVFEPEEFSNAHNPNCDRLGRRPAWLRETSRSLFIELLDDHSLRLHRKFARHEATSKSVDILDEIFTRIQ